MKEQLASVNPLLEVLRGIREERLRQFTDVQSQIEKIKAEIEGTTYHHPPTNAVKLEQDDLSIRKLKEYQLQLKGLQKDKVCFLFMQLGSLYLVEGCQKKTIISSSRFSFRLLCH